LVRLLAQHPKIRLTALTSQQFAGKRISDVYPSLAGRCDVVLQEVEADEIASCADVVFAALPHGASMDTVPRLVERNLLVLDLSADFRLHDAEAYRQWYRPHRSPELLSQAVYGLTEIHRRRLQTARFVAVPGCYPTGAILGLAPLFARNIAEEGVIIDAKSGVTGAGRSSDVELSFSEVNENFKAYNVGVHRHTPEIEQELSEVAGRRVSVLFTPHLLPVNRGILSTMYVRIKTFPGERELEEMYREFYRDDPFIRVLPYGSFPQTKDVRGSNECSVGFRQDSRAGWLVVITVIDNLVKGAAGQAVQDMNLMCGFPETEGLARAALVP
jgi:N-acetyl-gamma-glutamyl-phosphate reductase